MKKIIFLFIILFSISSFGYAQTADELFSVAENIKIKKSEQSKDYLEALSAAIQQASNEGDINRAYINRMKHTEIVKNKYGKTSLEYADDLFRLGNTSLMLGDTTNSLNYYIHSSEIFNKQIKSKTNIEYANTYIFVLSQIVELSASINSYQTVEKYSSQLKSISKQYFGASSCDHIDWLFFISQRIIKVGLIDKAQNYINDIIEFCSAIDSCNYQYVDAAYSFLDSYYYEKDQKDLQIQIAQDYLSKLNLSKEPFFNEKVRVLKNLMFYYDDMNISFEYGELAKNLLENSHDRETLYRNPDYYQILYFVALNRYIVGDYTTSKHYFIQCLDVLRANGNTQTKDYYDVETSIFECATISSDYNLMLDISPDLENLIFKYSESPIQDIFSYALNMADATSKIGQYDQALRFYNDALGVLPQLASGDVLLDAKSRIYIAKAEIYTLCGNKEDALMCLNKGKQYFEDNPNNNNLSVRANIYSLEGQLLSEYNESMLKFDKALDSYKTLYELTQKSEEVTTEGLSLINRLSGITMLNMGLVQYKHGHIQDAYKSFTNTLSIFENIDYTNNMDYLMCRNNIALCQMDLGHYADAIITLDDIYQLVKDYYGTDNLLYPTCLQNYALYYHTIGDFDKALYYGEQALQVYKRLYGETSYQYYQMLGSVGSMYVTLNQPQKGYEYLSIAHTYLSNNDSSPYVKCQIIKNLARASFALDNVSEGVNYYNDALRLTDSIYGVVSKEHSQLIYMIGYDIAHYEKGLTLSYDYFLNAAATMGALGLTHDPLYKESLIYLGASGILLKKELPSDYTSKTIDAVINYYGDNMAFYSSYDREREWSYLSNIKHMIFTTSNNEFDNIFLYDYILFSKSLMLSTSNKIHTTIKNTSNQEFQEEYDNIRALQTAINNHSFNNALDNGSLDKQQELLVSMERSLIAKLKEQGLYSPDNTIGYSDVIQHLKKNEIAIEFVDYYNIQEEQTYYIALLAKSSWDKPVYVPLCKDTDLNNCIGNPNVMYSTDELYQLLWQPLLKYINKGDVVYFSPSGKLHTISIEALHTPDGSYLKDNYNLIRLTSTRELCVAKPTKAYKSSVIYGGLNYDVEQHRMKEIAQQYGTVSGDNILLSLRGDNRGNWNYLPGTKEEASQIAVIMQKSKIKYDVYESDFGNEESFKSLSDKDIDIIHLATHGFFIKSDMTDKNLFMNNLSNNNDSIIDPMLRSGLILSGGNNAWLGNATSSDIEDGVLTALEISNMNLSNTDLVVLSACETGLGEITNDGVFGLQRAFKIAGVQTLVMSLWKVDDMATSLMMQTFYEQLLSGKSKRDAFNIAQNTVRNKYPEPYYWAAFIMLD